MKTPEKILFLTGRLAEKQLHKTLDAIVEDGAEMSGNGEGAGADVETTNFAYKVRQIGISVAALMTGDLIRRRLEDIDGADRILVPGRCQGDLDELSRHFNVPVERGPDDLKDLPEFFGQSGRAIDLSRHDCRIFAEIVDAPKMRVDAILERAAEYKAMGADVIDIGGLPDTDFPHLEEAVGALKKEGYGVSVDSADPQELLRGGKAGADYLLSLTHETLSIADEVSATPVLIPATPGDMESLYQAIGEMEKKGKPFLVDPILDPIHFGFTRSLVRYHDLREKYPDVEILMGVGNLTELTDADTTGITALLMGVVSELNINAVLVVQVSPHCRRAVAEADIARRIMYLAKSENRLPVGLSGGLMGLHDRKPFLSSEEEITDMAALVRDPSFRVQAGENGLYVFNRDGVRRASDPFELFPQLGLEDDAPHAFYMGVELARAEIAWRLGKRYSQDTPLDWGCAVPAKVEDEDTSASGHTLVVAAEKRAAKKRQKAKKKKLEEAGNGAHKGSSDKRKDT